jgi:cysteine desulfurase
MPAPRVYLDHNATTPLDPRVLEAMLPILRDSFGNPSSIHWFGQQARAAMDDARAQVAALVGAHPSEVVFTSSGTEADNAALRGVAGEAREGRRRILYAGFEHHAVMHTARALGEEGWPVETLRVGHDGVVDMEDLQGKLGDDCALVCVMLANNETGVVQPVAEVARLSHAHGATVHCDAVQAAGKVPVDIAALGTDTLALSAHKFYGPKGVGALVVKRGTKLRAWSRGGSQERNRRAGTENVAGIVGMGHAAMLARTEMPSESPRLTALRDALEERLRAECGALRNGDGPRVPNTANLSFPGVEAESLLMALDLAGVAVSTGAACAAGAVQPSHVLRAMGLSMERVQSSIRFSLGRSSDEATVARATEAVTAAIARQRTLARR